MSALNYLKLDFTLMKGRLKFYAFMPLIFVILFLKDSPVMGVGYLFFFFLIIAATPFSTESNEKCNKMYYMLPSRISSMVLGRFLYLISVMSIIWILSGTLMIYSSSINTMSDIEVGIMSFSGILATVVCFCQYPIYYKYGIEKGRILSMLLYMLPAFMIFSLPSVLSNNKFFTQQTLSKILTFIIENKNILPIISIIIISIIGYIAYLVSCSICKRKEI